MKDYTNFDYLYHDENIDNSNFFNGHYNPCFKEQIQIIKSILILYFIKCLLIFLFLKKIQEIFLLETP